MVSPLTLGVRKCQFEPDLPDQYSSVSQQVQNLSCKQALGGSNPLTGSEMAVYPSGLRGLSAKQIFGSSNLSTASIWCTNSTVEFSPEEGGVPSSSLGCTTRGL